MPLYAVYNACDNHRIEEPLCGMLEAELPLVPYLPHVALHA